MYLEETVSKSLDEKADKRNSSILSEEKAIKNEATLETEDISKEQSGNELSKMNIDDMSKESPHEETPLEEIQIAANEELFDHPETNEPELSEYNPIEEDLLHKYFIRNIK